MRVHSSPTLSPFRGWAQDRVSSATALILEDGLPPVMLTLTPIALRRPTHRPAGLCELLPPLAERVRLKPLFGWHRQRLQQSCLRLPRFTGFHRPAGQREPNSADMARCQPFSTTLSGSPECGYHALLSPSEGYLLDASHGQGSRATRISSSARVSFPDRRFPCFTACAARSNGPVAFPQEGCSPSSG